MGIVDTVRADLVVRAANGKAVLVVESRESGKFPEVGRRALALVSDAFRPDYAMLATPEMVEIFALSTAPVTDSARPTATVQTAQLAESYLPGRSGMLAGERVVLALIERWLMDLIENQDREVPGGKEMEAAGLLKELTGAEVLREESTRLYRGR